MNEFNSIDEILAFAMNEEQQAVEFYTSMADSSKTEDMKQVFIEFAEEEMGHKARLAKIRMEGSFSLEAGAIMDLKIADYSVNVKLSPDMTYQDALVVAMRKEKAAFRLYNALAERAPNEEMKRLFLSLAQEESKHKLRFEVEYDEFVLREN
jgi:rubrerythrin